MEKIVKPYLSQIIWLVTAVTSCFVGLSALGFQLFNDSVIDVALPISLMIGLAGLIGMIMLFIDQPEYCKLEK
jgi:hypothetical protein